MSTTTKPEESRKTIKFNFRPYEIKKGDYSQYAIEKAINGGSKRKYMCGVTSGIKIDGHGERMTEKCIKDFMGQANSGDILLYADAHGIKASDDIGILTKGEIKDDEDWYTEYRLYDKEDDIGSYKLEKIKNIWKQATGQPPYKQPLEKGFSIEGYISEKDVLSGKRDQFGNMTERVIDKVGLDGVILVPKPAYKDSIAHSCYKALDEITPYKEKTVRKAIKDELKNMINDQVIQDSYYTKQWDIKDALDTMVTKIMTSADTENKKKQQLNIIFDEYKDLMIDLILQSQSLFASESEVSDANAYESGSDSDVRKSEIFKSLLEECTKLEKLIKPK